MQKKFKYFLSLLAFFLLALGATPHAAFAFDTSNIPTGADAPAVTPDCPQNNAIDAGFFQTRAHEQQRKLTLLQTLNTMFPVAPALNQCLKNILNTMALTPSLADPLGWLTSTITSLLTSIINQVCSQIIGEITMVQQDITNLAKICIPLPRFNGLDLPQLRIPQCSGGSIQVSPLGAWTPTPPLFNVNSVYNNLHIQ